MNRKKVFILLLAAIFICLFFWFDLGRYLTLESLKQNRDYLATLYRDHPIATVAVFMAIYIIQTALALPGAAILSLAAGAVFGVLMGTLYANIGATIGATLSFLVARYLFHDTIQGKFGPRLVKINKELDNAGFNYLLFLRLVPLFPFFLINLAAGLTKIPLQTFFFGTMLGIIPGGFVFCNAGASLASINSVGEIVSPRVLGSFALLGLFALIPVIYGKIRGVKKPSV
ncbi:MAG: TVP38/TMEM64 family protein [Geobacteraceae bacterium]|nr:TVP38/TMEM64 family protein [Geobacteraceae bacterium]